MNNTLIVHFNSRKIYFGMLVTLVITGILLLAFLFLGELQYPELTAMLRIILLPIIAIFLFCLVYGLFLDLKKPAFVMDHYGIWVSRFGLIPWDSITKFEIYLIPGTPLAVLGIRLIDPEKIHDQSTLEGKMVLFWAHFFGYQYHISLANLAVENNIILAYASHFRNQQS